MEVKCEQPETKRPSWPAGMVCRCKKRTRYVQPARVESYKPNQQYKCPSAAVSGDTIYNKSYKDFNLDELGKSKGTPVHPKDNLVSAGDFQSDTTNKMSYCPWEGYTRSAKIGPKDHCIAGVGPIQDMTTNRHDYTPKYIPRPEPIKPPGCLGMSEKAMENNTTNLLSYGWPDNQDPCVSYKPQQRYLPPSNKMEQDTVQKLSFRPWENRKKEIYPWAAKPKYNTPTTPVDGQTIYNNSFYAPGKYVDDPSCEVCVCEPVSVCAADVEPSYPPKAHEYVSCTPANDNNTPNCDESHEKPLDCE